MMPQVAIIDYGSCNLDSISRAVSECGGNPTITETPSALASADFIILPGVGSFRAAMTKLKAKRLEEAIHEELEKRPVSFLGICLGMQMLADKSMEDGETEGLSLVPGEVVRLEPASKEERVPHMGWNEVVFTKDIPLFEGIPSGADYYFVHSYHFRCADSFVLGRTPYCRGFNSIVGHENIIGVQFHPEKSLEMGLTLIRNFLDLN